ncbi:MAG: IS4 family transposase [Oscillospiraceae bacterium]|nr:IS4 family transposase [Oscillospiraceae bacterium]
MSYASYQKALLNDVLDDACYQYRDLLSDPDRDFTRDRKLPLKTMLQIIISMQGGSINRELFDYDKSIDASSSAFVQQREKIKPEMFKQIFRLYNRMCDDDRRYKGYRLLAVDGSAVCIAKNPDSETYFENGDNEGYNQFHMNAMYDVLNKTYYDCIIQPRPKSNEIEACRQMVLSNSFDKAILLADRNYGSLNLFETICRTDNLDFLFRIKNDWLREVNALPMKELDTVISFDVYGPKGRKRLPKGSRRRNKHQKPKYLATWRFEERRVHLRVVRFKITNSTYETIITSLNRFEFPLKKIKELYHMRWGIETSFRELKYAIGLVNFHAKKESLIQQEIYARMILYNFCERIIARTVINHDNNRKWTYQVNYTMAIHVCRDFLQYHGGDPPPDPEKYITRYILPVRPDRSDERKKKPKAVIYFLYRVA